MRARGPRPLWRLLSRRQRARKSHQHCNAEDEPETRPERHTAPFFAMKRKTAGLRRKTRWSCEVRAKEAAAPVNELASYYKSVLTVAVRGFQDWITDFPRALEESAVIRVL
jgi:hypothetical protein